MAAAEPLRKISEEEITNFHRDGAVLLKGVLPDAWNDVLEEGLEYAESHPDGLSAGVSLPLRIDQFPASYSPPLQKLMDESPIAEIVGTVLDAPVRFYMDQMFYKPAGLIVPSAWHQDTCYYNVEGHQLIRAWVCVDPAPRDVSLEVLRGSHLWNVTYRPPVGKNPANDPEGAAALDAAFARGEILIGREAHEKWILSTFWAGITNQGTSCYSTAISFTRREATWSFPIPAGHTHRCGRVPMSIISGVGANRFPIR
jgi:hypothetical protein